jgi:hypothetical protein
MPVRRLDVRDHHLQTLHGPGLGIGEAETEGDRARRPRRCQLDEAELVADPVVVIRVEADLVDVERLRPIDVRHGDCDELELPVHEMPSVS